jgi:hypothetical protein
MLGASGPVSSALGGAPGVVGPLPRGSSVLRRPAWRGILGGLAIARLGVVGRPDGRRRGGAGRASGRATRALRRIDCGL